MPKSFVFPPVIEFVKSVTKACHAASQSILLRVPKYLVLDGTHTRPAASGKAAPFAVKALFYSISPSSAEEGG